DSPPDLRGRRGLDQRAGDLLPRLQDDASGDRPERRQAAAGVSTRRRERSRPRQALRLRGGVRRDHPGDRDRGLEEGSAAARSEGGSLQEAEPDGGGQAGGFHFPEGNAAKVASRSRITNRADALRALTRFSRAGADARRARLSALSVNRG